MYFNLFLIDEYFVQILLSLSLNWTGHDYFSWAINVDSWDCPPRLLLSALSYSKLPIKCLVLNQLLIVSGR